MYLFTDIKAKKVIAIKICGGGRLANKYRKALEKGLKKPLVVWAQVGGDNNEVEKEK